MMLEMTAFHFLEVIESLQEFIPNWIKCGCRNVISAFRNSLPSTLQWNWVTSFKLSYLSASTEKKDIRCQIQRAEAILKMISASSSINLDNSDRVNLWHPSCNERGSQRSRLEDNLFFWNKQIFRKINRIFNNICDYWIDCAL